MEQEQGEAKDCVAKLFLLEFLLTTYLDTILKIDSNTVIPEGLDGFLVNLKQLNDEISEVCPFRVETSSIGMTFIFKGENTADFFYSGWGRIQQECLLKLVAVRCCTGTKYTSCVDLTNSVVYEINNVIVLCHSKGRRGRFINFSVFNAVRLIKSIKFRLVPPPPPPPKRKAVELEEEEDPMEHILKRCRDTVNKQNAFKNSSGSLSIC